MYKLIDNFFENPHEIRQIALNLLSEKYDCILNDSTKNYPGIRCSVQDKIITSIVTFLEKTLDTNIINFYCAFHITSGIHRLGLIHKDRQKYAGLIYLNENPPEHSGTILCNQIVDISSVEHSNNFGIASSTHDIKIITEFADYKEQFNKNFEIEVELTNKFNRFVLYNGTRYHAPYYYFGNNMFNSRLVLVFWFDVV
jgi:hypothetical protein